MILNTRSIAALLAFLQANASECSLTKRRVNVCTGNAERDRALNNVDRDAAIVFIRATRNSIPSLHSAEPGSAFLADVAEHIMASAVLGRLVEAGKQARVSRARMVEILECARRDADEFIDAASYNIEPQMA